MKSFQMMEEFLLKDNKSNKIKIGPSESMSKSKKTQLIQKIQLRILELMQLDLL